MDKLRKHIKESFFNPILHFLPLLLFLVLDDYYGILLAWEVSFPFALLLLIYIYFVFNGIFTWHLIGTLIFVLASLIVAVETFIPVSFISHQIVYETVVLSFFIVFILFRKRIQKLVYKVMSNLIPMTNNFEELYRVIWSFALVFLIYITGFLIVQVLGQNVETYHELLQSLSVAVLFFLSVYEILRVQIIRSKLIREEWLPIVNNLGKIVGSIQLHTSMNDEKKYQHPVIRILFVDKGMILLNKKQDENNLSADVWDSTISNHVVMEETIEQCVDRTVKQKLDIDNFKYMHLSTYTVECKKEIQHAFLFVSCMQSEYKVTELFIEQAKWWTQSQIEENLESGIFTDNFKIEYDLLKRGGLLETGKCECNCRLKQVIYNQSNGTKKE
ncbi:MAG: hypothetical protein WCO28_11465 [Bacteroidota bacterium]|jgi:isopentenyldiphosphate isomerase